MTRLRRTFFSRSIAPRLLPNAPAQQRRGLLELPTWESLRAPAVCCSWVRPGCPAPRPRRAHGNSTSGASLSLELFLAVDADVFPLVGVPADLLFEFNVEHRVVHL